MTTTTQRTVTEQQARRLAVCYSGYSAALDAGARRTWGQLLQTVQAETGIDLVRSYLLCQSLRSAQHTLSQLASVGTD